MPEPKDQAELVNQLRRHSNHLLQHLAALKEGRAPALDHDTMLDLVADAMVAAHLLQSAFWRSPALPPVAACGATAHESFSIQVLGVIDDAELRFGEQDAYVDVVAYWPAKRRWTVTHQTRADTEAADYDVNVVAWKPLDAPPARAGALAPRLRVVGGREAAGNSA